MIENKMQLLAIKLLNPEKRLSVLLLILACLLSASSLVMAKQEEGKVSNCLSTQAIIAELEPRIEKLEKLRNGLDSFTAGKGTADVPLSALFLIDLNDADAVAKRVQALKQEAATLDEVSISDPVINCALGNKVLRPLADEALCLKKSIIALRLQFLSLEPEKRKAILQPLLEATVQANTVKQLQEERTKALVDQKKVAKSLAQVEQQELISQADSDNSLVAAQAELERVKSQLTSLQIQLLTDLEKEIGFYQGKLEEIAQIGSSYLAGNNPKSLKADYDSSVVIWRELVDKTLKVVTDKNPIKLPPLPTYPDGLLERLGNSQEVEKYKEAYADTKMLWNSLNDKATSGVKSSVDLHYRVLLQSGELRSRLLNRLIDSGDYSPLSLTMPLFQDIRREACIVPYRWVALIYTKSMDVERRLHQGWRSIVEGLLNLILLIGLLLIPWVMWLISKQLVVRLNTLQSDLVRQSKSKPWAKNLALAIQRILPYTSWLVLLAAIPIAQWLLQNSMISELGTILTYVRYYVYYRLFRQLMQFDYAWVNQQIKVAKLWDLRRQINKTSRIMGLLAFYIFCLLSIIESLTRRGLIYHFSITAFYYLAILFLFVITFQWRHIISLGLRRFIPGKLGDQLAKVCISRWGILLALPGFLLILCLLILRLFVQWGQHFEVSKRVAAQVFRLQLENTIDNQQGGKLTQPPQNYSDFFSLSGINNKSHLFKPNFPAYEDITQHVKNWSLGVSAVNSQAIVGFKGTGKTCLLQYLANNIKNTRIVYKAVPGKLTNRGLVLDFFSGIPGLTTADGNFALANPEENNPKLLLLVDDAHNLFLGKEGGFEGFQTFLELISQAPKNIFICIGFNQNAWGYINGVYARQAYFDVVSYLPLWPESAIQKLILDFHADTGYQLSYDGILQAVGSQTNLDDVVYVENRFFSLLRQQSRGNPRLAIYLWLTSLHSVGNRSLRVGLPVEPETIILSQLPDAAIFVFASIARHENLCLSEILTVTQLPEGVVHQALDIGMRANLLQYDSDQRFRLSILFQYPLINYLKAKNCLYE